MNEQRCKVCNCFIEARWWADHKPRDECGWCLEKRNWVHPFSKEFELERELVTPDVIDEWMSEITDAEAVAAKRYEGIT